MLTAGLGSGGRRPKGEAAGHHVIVLSEHHQSLRGPAVDSGHRHVAPGLSEDVSADWAEQQPWFFLINR